jgi:hypothetical protein
MIDKKHIKEAIGFRADPDARSIDEISYWIVKAAK